MTELDIQSFKTIIADTKGLKIIVLYYEWSGNYVIMKPVIEKITKMFRNKLDFYSFNVSEHPEILNEYQLTETPAYLFFCNKDLVKKIIGLASPKEFINSILSIMERNNILENKILDN